MSLQETLNQLGSLTRKRNPKQDLEQVLETIARDYTHAMVYLSKSNYSITSLLEEDGERSRPIQCPLDNANAQVLINGVWYRGYETCKKCSKCLVCTTDIRTREFQFLGKTKRVDVLKNLTSSWET